MKSDRRQQQGSGGMTTTTTTATMVKPKSSQGGTVAQRRLLKKQTNALKEIHAWARRAEDSTSCHVSRMSGQLTDNVTEDRMLRAKLWELSKERYKSAYEKKLFTDRIQRQKSRSSSAPSYSSMSRGGGQHRPPASLSAVSRSVKSANSMPQIYNTSTRSVSSMTRTGNSLQSTSQSAHRTPVTGQSLSKTSLKPLVSSSQGWVSKPQVTLTQHHLQAPPQQSSEVRPVSRTSPRKAEKTKPEQLQEVEKASRTQLQEVKKASRAQLQEVEKASCAQLQEVEKESRAQQQEVEKASRAQLQEVEMRWATSRGRGKVTPAATAVTFAAPDALDGSGDRLTLAPLQQRPPPSQAVEDSVGGSQSSSSPSLPACGSLYSGRQARGVPKKLPAHSSLTHRRLTLPTASSPLTLPGSSAPLSKPSSASNQRSKSWSPNTVNSVTAPQWPRPAAMRQRYGMRLSSKTTDPRYAKLEQSLIPVKDHTCLPDVSTVVQTYDALRLQPRVQNEVKPKKGLKAMKYIDEQGFVF